MQTREDSDGIYSFVRIALIQAVSFGSLSENLKKIIPDAFVNRFVQCIT